MFHSQELYNNPYPEPNQSKLIKLFFFGTANFIRIQGFPFSSHKPFQDLQIADIGLFVFPSIVMRDV